MIPGTQPLPLSPDSRSLLSPQPQGKTRWTELALLLLTVSQYTHSNSCHQNVLLKLYSL